VTAESKHRAFNITGHAKCSGQADINTHRVY